MNKEAILSAIRAGLNLDDGADGDGEGHRDQPLSLGSPDEIAALGAACREEVEKHGYALVHSDVLNETFVVIANYATRSLAPPGYLTLTFFDLARLAAEYRSGRIRTVVDLRRWLQSVQKQEENPVVRAALRLFIARLASSGGPRPFESGSHS